MIYTTKYGASFGYITDPQPDADPPQTQLNMKHSYRDYLLLPVNKPVIEPPAPKVYTVDVPGANGVLDLSESLTGYPVYYNRKGTFNYIYLGERKDWDRLYHRILTDIHGKVLSIILDEDPYGFYKGRCTVEPPTFNNNAFYLTITADLYPYKKDIATSVEPWKWDPFSFETGVIRDYAELHVNEGEERFVLIGSAEPLVPHVYKLSGQGTLSYHLRDNSLKSVFLMEDTDNTKLLTDFVLHEGENEIFLNGNNFTVMIEFRAGVL